MLWKKTQIRTLLIGASLACPAILVHAQTADPVACSIQDSSGARACEELRAADACDSESNYASRPSNDSTDIEFVNRSDQPVKVYWLNFQGKRVPYNRNLAPGGRQTQRTFVGHNWLVASPAGQCLGIFKTDSPPLDAAVAVLAAPPEIPVDEQPPPPEENLIWTPGYWAWSGDTGDYYWVHGSWVDAPIVGYLWTPGYWLVQGRGFIWQAGYWGPHVGFYGGINYDHGYFGRGFVGGSWRDGRMMYNGAVTNVGNLSAVNVYHEPAASDASLTRVSFNGTGGGVRARPGAPELAAANEYHIPPTAAQERQFRTARSDGSTGSRFAPAPNSPASNASGQHAGTLSVMHSSAPSSAPEPSRVVPASSATYEAAPAQPRAGVPRLQQPSTAQRTQQPRETAPQTAPRIAPRGEPHAEPRVEPHSP